MKSRQEHLSGNSTGPSNRSQKSKLPIPKSRIPINSSSMPNFSRLHDQLSKEQAQRKEALKKAPTIPKEFKFATRRNIPSTSSNLAERNVECNKENAPVTSQINSNIARQSRPFQNVSSKPSQFDFKPCALSLRGILSGKGIADPDHYSISRKSCFQPSSTFASTRDHLEIGRKSLGPPMRPKPLSVDPFEESRKSFIDTSRKSQTLEDEDGMPLSKLERRISTYFSRGSSQPGQHAPVTPAKLSTRVGMAIIEIQKTPKFTQDLNGNSKNHNEGEWIRQLAERVLDRAAPEKDSVGPAIDTDLFTSSSKNRTQPEIEIVLLDNPPKPPPPLTDRAQLDFPHEQVFEKRLSGLRRNHAELFGVSKIDRNRNDSETLFSAPHETLESSKDGFAVEDEDNTYSFMLNKKKYDTRKQSQNETEERETQEDELTSGEDIQLLMEELHRLDMMEKQLEKELELL